MIVFSSDLGWMGAEVTELAIRRLSFGYPSEDAVVQAMDRSLLATTDRDANAGPGPCSSSPMALIRLSNRARGAERRRLLPWQCELVDLLQSYANGGSVDFSFVPVQLDAVSEFRRDVLNACRKIVYGRTVSYGQLAAKVGVPGAARAVGTCMARNPLPLVIPCHRVTRAGGKIGPYSAAGGTATKRRLLDMEAAHV